MHVYPGRYVRWKVVVAAFAIERSVLWIRPLEACWPSRDWTAPIEDIFDISAPVSPTTDESRPGDRVYSLTTLSGRFTCPFRGYQKYRLTSCRAIERKYRAAVLSGLCAQSRRWKDLLYGPSDSGRRGLFFRRGKKPWKSRPAIYLPTTAPEIELARYFRGIHRACPISDEGVSRGERRKGRKK